MSLSIGKYLILERKIKKKKERWWLHTFDVNNLSFLLNSVFSLLLLLSFKQTTPNRYPWRPLNGKNAKSLSFSSSNTSTGMRRNPFVEVGSRPEKCTVPRAHQSTAQRAKKVGSQYRGQSLLLIRMEMRSNTISSYSPWYNGPSAFMFKILLPICQLSLSPATCNT